MREKEIKG